ncbi:MAG: prephenate dehydratase [Lachnospiraceae bacterium]|nr:prephenate dehydratase [Lachnospiraceae bacterium]
MKIGILGPEGTFSDKAYMEYCKKIGVELQGEYYPTIDEVFEAVCSDNDKGAEESCDLCIVPIENTLDGYVQRTLDLLLEKNVCIIDENKVSVQFSLVGNVKSLDEIKTLYVQFKANGQCRQFINTLKGAKIISTESNMESYYKLGDEEGAAAIVPHHIAVKETGRFVVENVTDSDHNHTRFLIVKKGLAKDNKATNEPTNPDAKEKVRVPIYVMPVEDRPGILFELLKSFNDNKINMISIMSRPTKQELGTYNFYIEIDGRMERLDVILDTLEEIRKSSDVKVLGIYKE